MGSDSWGAMHNVPPWFFGGYFTRRLCASVSCLSGGFIHPDVPLRAESCKAPLTPDSDPFRLQGAYSPHMFLSVRFFCFAQMLFFSFFLLLSIQWFLSFLCVVTLQTRSGAYATSRWHPFSCFKHYLYVLRASFVSRKYLPCKTTTEVSHSFFSSSVPAPSLSTVLSTIPNPNPGHYVPVRCDKQQLLACMLILHKKRRISLFSSSCGAPVFPMHSFAAGCHK